jgi:hypothetical protein
MDMLGHEFQVAAGLCNLQPCHSGNWQPGVGEIKMKPPPAALASQQRSAPSAVSVEPSASVEEPCTFVLPPGLSQCRNAWNVYHKCSPFCLTVLQVETASYALTPPGCRRSHHANGYSQPRRWSHPTGSSLACARC